MKYTFPPDFVWGAATSAYQIEGATAADGRGPSIWDTFAATPGAIKDGTTGAIACDHYRRYPEDVKLLHDLDIPAYRFSVAWPRILPQGRGRPNAAGLDFYDRLIDRLAAAGIVPFATLYHWDLPQALDDVGGWTHPDVAGWFADYAHVVVRRLGDRVRFWATLNEPWVVTDGGYLHGVLAPGVRSAAATARASCNLLLAHAAGLRAMRAAGAVSCGIVLNLEPKYSASSSKADREATARADAYMNRQYLDPLFFGRYPEELAELYGEVAGADHSALPAAGLDFLGVNYYRRQVVRHDPSAWPLRAAAVPQPNEPHTALGWEIHPPGLLDVLTWVRARYGELPLYVTENGAAFDDPVHDPARIAYLRDHLKAVHEAIARGADVRGYFVWSLLDNFEWAEGYTQRFGIVSVDFATQARTPRDSARFYGEVVRSNGAALWA